MHEHDVVVAIKISAYIYGKLINFSMGACYLDFTVCIYTYVTSVGVRCREVLCFLFKTCTGFLTVGLLKLNCLFYF